MFKGQIIGHIGQDAATGVSPKGSNYATFSVAARTGYGQNEETTWIDCIMSGNTNVAAYLTKGTQVFAEGELTLDEYKGRAKVKMSVRNVKLLSRKDG